MLCCISGVLESFCCLTGDRSMEIYRLSCFIVDENLFYKGVDKKVVHGARLHQSHSMADPTGHPTPSPDTASPPYPFVVGPLPCVSAR